MTLRESEPMRRRRRVWLRHFLDCVVYFASDGRGATDLRANRNGQRHGSGRRPARHYARNLLYLTVSGLVIANTINAGADIGAIAAAINLLVPIPSPFWSCRSR